MEADPLRLESNGFTGVSTMLLVLCRDPLEPTRPDRAFKAEVAAIEGLGLPLFSSITTPWFGMMTPIGPSGECPRRPGPCWRRVGDGW